MDEITVKKLAKDTEWARVLSRNLHVPFVQRILNLKQEVPNLKAFQRKDKDGKLVDFPAGSSTHLMSDTGDEGVRWDGKRTYAHDEPEGAIYPVVHASFPTLVRNEAGGLSKASLEDALRAGNFISFNTAEEAKRFSSDWHDKMFSGFSKGQNILNDGGKREEPSGGYRNLLYGGN
jgi:hypothetical protein